MEFEKYLINKSSSVKIALEKLNEISTNAILFVVDDNNKLIGSLTDGDLRRGFINGLDFDSYLTQFIQSNPRYILQGCYDVKEIIELREQYFYVFPVVNTQLQIINIVNFRQQKSYLPIDVLIMAGGRGERLKPLTDNVPKPLLLVGDKPIIEHNIDQLKAYGIDDIWISLKYLGNQLIDYFKDGRKKGIRIKYVSEENSLGTAGALALVNDFIHEHVLLMNSDLLTNINFEDLYLFFIESQADFVVVSIPYQINIPYAVMEIEENLVKGFREKPTYTYYSNAGIYLMKKDVIKNIPKNTTYNATDLMEQLIKDGKKVVAYPFLGYWIDIGKHDDYKKALQDIKSIKF